MLESPKTLESYLTDDDFAVLLGITVARLRNKVSAGEPLPPYILPPNCRRRLWPSSKVNEWFARFTVVDPHGVHSASPKNLRKRRAPPR